MCINESKNGLTNPKKKKNVLLNQAHINVYKFRYTANVKFEFIDCLYTL